MASLSESYALLSQPLRTQPFASPGSSTVALLSSKLLTLFSLKDGSALAALDLPFETLLTSVRLLEDRTRFIAVASDKQIAFSKTLVKRDGTFQDTPEFSSTPLSSPIKSLLVMQDSLLTLDDAGTLQIYSHGYTKIAHVCIPQHANASRARLEAFSSAQAPFPIPSTATLIYSLTFHTSVQSSPTVASPKKKSKKAAKENAALTSQRCYLTLSILDNDKIKILNTIEMLGSDLAEVSISPTGHITSISKSEWKHYLINPTTYELDQLRSLTLNPDLAISSSSEAKYLLPLQASFVLLATPFESSIEKLQLSIWDIRHGVAVCQSEVQLSSQHATFHLAQASSCIVLAHSTTTEARVYGITLECPAESRLALIVGKRALSDRYLKVVSTQEKRDEQEKRRKSQQHPLISDIRARMQERAAYARYDLLDAIQEQPSMIDALFKAWVQQQVDALSQYALQKAERRQKGRLDQERRATLSGANAVQMNKGSENTDMEMEGEMAEDCQPEGTASESDPEVAAAQQPRLNIESDIQIQKPGLNPFLPAAFTNEIISRCLDCDVETFPKMTLQYLMARRAVADTDAPGGLTKALFDRQLWLLVELCLHSVPDIKEDDLIQMLQQTIQADPQHMPIDRLLVALIDYPVSAKQMRTAMKRHLSMDNVKAILSLLQNWLPDLSMHQSRDVPTLHSLLLFVTHLVDANFVSLLQEDDCHAGVQQLHASLQLIIQTTEDWISLKGSLENVDRERKRAIASKDEPQDFGEYTLDSLEI